jgi:hypothetical protein
MQQVPALQGSMQANFACPLRPKQPLLLFLLLLGKSAPAGM